MRVALALGNPGPAYVTTRHNAGFLVADALVAGWELPPFRQAGNALVTEGSLGSDRLVLVKPLTYMNLSGAALEPFRGSADFFPERDLLVISDDFAIPLGTFRLRAAGSSGGHNGLASVEQALNSQAYPRLRVGIGPLPPGGPSTRDFVLGRFAPEELDKLGDLLPDIADAVETWLTEGIELAMSRSNKRTTPNE
jgi:peptidyl-tRNA hydrolase, PTH1 family